MKISTLILAALCVLTLNIRANESENVKSGILFHYNPESTHGLYLDRAISASAARFLLPESAWIRGLTLRAKGDADAAARVRVVRPTADLRLPDTAAVVLTANVKKLHNGSELIRVDFPKNAELLHDQVFVIVDRLRGRFTLLSDSEEHPPICEDINGERFNLQYVLNESGKWLRGPHAFLVELNIETSVRDTGSRFSNAAPDLRIDRKSSSIGVAWQDFNGDGFADLLSGGRLYRNNGGNSFTEVQSVNESLSDGLMQMFIDLDGDGDADIFSAGADESFFLINDDGRWHIRRSEFLQVAVPLSYTLGDINNDGLSDLLYIDAKSGKGRAHVLLNNGAAELHHSAAARNIETVLNRVDGLTSVLAYDVNTDNQTDILLGAEGHPSPIMVLSDEQGRYTAVESTIRETPATMFGGGLFLSDVTVAADAQAEILTSDIAKGSINRMGVDAGKVNSNAPTEPLHWNTMGLLNAQRYRTGLKCGDLDNDGDLDLVVANLSKCRAIEVLFQQADGTYRNESRRLGLDLNGQTEDIVLVDYDLDGRLDICGYTDGTLHLFRNEMLLTGDYLTIGFRREASHADLAGTRIELHTKGDVRRQILLSGTGILMQGSPQCHFGLGEAEPPDSIVVVFPDGQRKTIDSPELNTLNQFGSDSRDLFDAPLQAKMDVLPNPARSFVDIRFELSADAPVNVEVYDSFQRRITDFKLGWRAAGSHAVTWEFDEAEGAEPIAAGAYFIHLRFGDSSIVKKIVVID